MTRLFATIFLLLVPAAGLQAAQALAFWYADDPPLDELAQFDRIVVEPEHFDAHALERLQQDGRIVHAYVSVGELHAGRRDADQVPTGWRLGRNAAWDSSVMDLASKDWRDYLFEHRFRPLWQAGYRGFFLDTLDSHRQFARSDAERAAQEAGLVALIERLHREFPQASILVNRGFEVIDRIAGNIDGMVAESLYAGWDAEGKRYREVPQADREWLLQRLRQVHERHPKLMLAVLDYLPSGARDRAREVARRIRDQGFVPWVSTIAQDQLGVGEVEVLPRRILMLYDGSPAVDGPLYQASIHVLAGVPVEYLGFVPEYLDVRKGLPRTPLRGRYAGVISWFGNTVTVSGLRDWVAGRLDEGVPVLMLGTPGFEPDEVLLARLGMSRRSTPGSGPWQVARKDGLIGFETRVPTVAGETRGFVQLRGGSVGNRVHLSVRDAAGSTHDVVVTGPWGGIALSPWVVEGGLDDRNRWIVDPFALIRTALHLPELPMPDVTTLNGRRLWLNHIDGDAFVSRAEMPGSPRAAEVIRDQILKRYRYPHTVSIVEGEIGPEGLYAKDSPELERIARSIFRLSNVEPASHTWSHPYKWQEIREGMPSGGGYSLAIPGYRYDLKREIVGSIEYINRRLLPPGRQCRILLWSGDALPTEAALHITAEHGYLNMNGGDTTIRRDRPWLSFVSPMARPVGPWLQVYAPIMNENVYTHEWQGPYYGFRRVIETFELTDRPLRLKPIDIYYHFYSGTKYASLKALQTVYGWAEKQETTPVYASEYIPLVHAFRRVSIARTADGRLRYRGLGPLRELRLLGGVIDPKRSTGLAGWRRLHDGLYLHLSSAHPVLALAVSDAALRSAGPHLHQANGRLERWRVAANGTIDLRLRAHVPVLLELAGVKQSCTLKSRQGKSRRLPARSGRVRLQYRKGKVVDGSLACH